MILYHGTDDFALVKILKCGYISNRVKSSAETNLIDTILEQYTNNKSIRKNKIYLSSDADSADGWDYAFKINTNKLDTSKLFVGNFNLVDSIYAAHMSNASQITLKNLVDNYINSIKSYNTIRTNSNIRNVLNTTVKYTIDNKLIPIVYYTEWLYHGRIDVT